MSVEILTRKRHEFAGGIVGVFDGIGGVDGHFDGLVEMVVKGLGALASGST